MHKTGRHWLCAMTLVAIGIVLAFSATASAGPKVISVTGIQETAEYRTIVHIRVEVAPGADPDVIAEETLRAFGARKARPGDISDPKLSLTGPVWSQFFNHGRRDDRLVQHYNPSGDPTGGHGLPVLLNAQTTWNSVRSTRFRFEFAGTTTRTPVSADGFNDVAWLEPPPTRPASAAAGDQGISRFSCEVCPCMRGVSDRAGSHRVSRYQRAGWSLPLLLTASAPRSEVLSRLNTRPARAPVNASTPPSQVVPHDSGSVWVASPSPYDSFIHYTSPV